MGKKRNLNAVSSGGENEIDLPSKFLKTTHGRMNEKRLIVILDGAQLEIVKVCCFREACFRAVPRKDPQFSCSSIGVQKRLEGPKLSKPYFSSVSQIAGEKLIRVVEQ